ncbi:hypothetical protein DCC39_03215 [Pueribacillus theae]|uniref:Uncharacterized protein n=1 Tax=Pueribacillus theae TaxID=2171751 RepID=A0A2U1K6Q9_9BACI|nr:hypothetical protein [Pueribacillus theae]PWA12894.1 hypothetical protein DCC39_03215 [Pueribacillus theae]
MESTEKVLLAAKFAGYTILSIGIAIFLYGLFVVSDYSAIIGVGIGTMMGAVFIFLIGVFFAATEEMDKNTDKGIKFSTNKGASQDTPLTYPKLKLIACRKS